MSSLRAPLRWTSVVVIALALACTADRVLAPNPIAGSAANRSIVMPSVRIAEFHYDNSSTDVGEAIEISGPAGTDLSGWRIVRYNGAAPAAGVVYTSPTGPVVGGVIPATCGSRGVLVFNYPQDGLQNGGNDGFALVDATNAVVEFLSYEGVMSVTGTPTTANPAAGMTSTDVGVSETGSANGTSIQRKPDGTWTLSAASTFGACNDDDSGVITPVVASITVAPSSPSINVGQTQQFTAHAFDASSQEITGVSFTWAPATGATATVNASGLATGVAAGDATVTATSGSVSGSATLHVVDASPYVPPDIRFSEIHYDNSGTDAGEGIEIEGPVGTSLDGWSILFYNGDPASTTTPLKVYLTTPVTGTLTAPISCGARGVLSVPVLNIQNGGTNGAQPDGFALVDHDGVLVEFLSYEGSFTAADGAANGVASRDIGVMEDNPVPDAGKSLHRSADGKTWNAPAAADMGFVNACGGPPPASITFSGRSATADPALPIGFEAQIFATEKVGGATVQTAGFVWSSDTPAIATIDQDGVFTALTAGTAVLRATATDGQFATLSLPTISAAQSSAPYGGNTEFGDPVDGDASDDFIIRRAEYTSSFNKNLGRPNWVSAKLDVTDYGAQDRCNCFTFDPELVTAHFARYTTADYTGAGAFAGYGIDRGHMTRSADRTASDLDNARTFYFSNVMPQAAANNQVTWKALEDSLGVLAEDKGFEVYEIAGGASSAAFPSKGFIKGESKVEMPGATWKVALVLDHGKGLADVHSLADVRQVFAVIMPNDPSINPDWTLYKTTVDAVEALSGYDVLSKLPDDVEIPLEANDKPPVAALVASYSGAEGSAIQLDASASADPDGSIVRYEWDFGDGTTAVTTDPRPTHAYADNGTFAIKLTVRDAVGAFSSASAAATIGNVPPTLAFQLTTSATIRSGETASVNGSFTDPGADSPWAWGINWGAGTPDAGTFSASGASATRSRALFAAGQYMIAMTVTDKDGAAATKSVVVNVERVAIAGDADPGTFRARDLFNECKHNEGDDHDWDRRDDWDRHRGRGRDRRCDRNNDRNDDVVITLSSSTVDLRTVDLSSIRIGDVVPERIKRDNDRGHRAREIKVRFSLDELVDAGALSAQTTQLVLFANLTTGVQLESRAAVRIR